MKNNLFILFIFALLTTYFRGFGLCVLRFKNLCLRVISCLLLICYILFALSANAETVFSANQINLIEKAIKFAEKKDWNSAISVAKKCDDKSLLKVIKWLQYKNDTKIYNFAELSEFYLSIKDWPLSDDIRIKVEESISILTAKKKIIDWFNIFPPISLDGHKKYLDCLVTNHAANDKIKEEVKYIFIHSNFTKDSKQKFYKQYSKYISKQDNLDRIEYLLHNKKTTDAKHEIYNLKSDYLDILKVRLALIDDKLNAISLFERLNKNQQLDQGLLFDLIKYYEKKNQYEKIVYYFNKVKSPFKYYKYWWGLKKRNIRSMIEHKHYKLAYQLVSLHQNENISDKIDAEWLAGWIALRYLNKPDEAIKHFNNMAKIGKLSVSISRAYYWIGRSYESKKMLNEANNAYKMAINYPLTFYGQLSMTKLNLHNTIAIPETKIYVTNIHMQQLKNNIIAKAAIILSFHKNYLMSHKFIAKAVKHSKSPEEIYLLALEGMKLGKNDFAVQTAKDASYINVMLPKFNFPIIKIENANKVDPAFIHALIRQESLFSYKGRVSSAGAMGLMQIMPHTGSFLAKSLGEKFDSNKLLHDPNYNIKLGVTYLNHLYLSTNGSYIMVAASYNAGSANVRKWVKRFGDPRTMMSIDKIVDWIELIPFEETRNYVMRILETTQIYHGILNHDKKFISNINQTISNSDE